MQSSDQREEFLHIIEKYLRGEASESERAFLKRYYDRFDREEDVLSALSAEERMQIAETVEGSIMESIGEQRSRRSHKLLPALLSAATLLIALSVGLYYYQATSDRAAVPADEASIASVDILPGTNKATLMLGDGTRVSLDDVAQGQIAEQSGVKVRKSDDGQVVYDASQRKNVDEVTFNTIVTPYGGQYRVTLPDGTNVWLNAGSSLRYPTAFTGKERKVELTGEGYFEVARRVDMPFRVVTQKQEIEVLGTTFNINSYTDEPSVRTTLLEGSIRVSSTKARDKDSSKAGEAMTVVLKPGEQSTLWDKGMSVATCNTDVVVAWKNGVFKFDGTDIGSVMRQLSKWYNVDVEFEGDVPDIRLWGEMDRSVNASQALEMLEYFNLKYKIIQSGDTRKIIIS